MDSKEFLSKSPVQKIEPSTSTKLQYLRYKAQAKMIVPKTYSNNPYNSYFKKQNHKYKYNNSISISISNSSSSSDFYSPKYLNKYITNAKKTWKSRRSDSSSESFPLGKGI